MSTNIVIRVKISRKGVIGWTYSTNRRRDINPTFPVSEDRTHLQSLDEMEG
jgi:hypothetical protein